MLGSLYISCLASTLSPLLIKGWGTSVSPAMLRTALPHEQDAEELRLIMRPRHSRFILTFWGPPPGSALVLTAGGTSGFEALPFGIYYKQPTTACGSTPARPRQGQRSEKRS